MARPTVSVGVELTANSNTFTDISAYVMSGNWFNGFAKPYDQLGRDSTATLVLRNSDKRFSPESGSVFSASWTRGKRIRIQTTAPDTTVRTMYLGWIKSIRPAPGTKGPRTCTVQCVSYFDKAQGYESQVPVQESKTADQVVTAIVGGAAIYPPGMTTGWELGTPGMGELGQKTYLGAASNYMTADTGRTTFNYVGDTWGTGVSVYGALRDTVGREGGRLFLNRSGLLEFWNRTHLITITASSATFTGQTDLSYNYGESLYNRATVRYRTRKVGSAPEVLSRIDKATKIAYNTTTTVEFRYADLTTSGAKIGGKNAITPVANTDYTINSAQDGTGTNYTGSATVAITVQTATSCKVTFTPVGIPGDCWIQAGATLRGTAIRDFGQQAVTADDSVSITNYGLQPITYGAEMDNAEDALGMARYIVAYRKIGGQVESVNVGAMRTAAQMNTCLGLVVGSMITLTEAQTGVNAAKYFIVGEKHSFSPGVYDINWTVEPASAYTFWTLGTVGYGELGQNTYLGPY